MRKLIIGLIILICNFNSNAQLCPGGGVNFANIVTFNQTWIQGCLTGTSCNGGIGFDNRAGCEPTTALDACAPAPSCTVATNGSDIWFRFYATSTSATINVIQQVSFVAVIQAFSGGPTCGGLTQIGCAVAGGPSSGIALNLPGLTLGQTYYFRIFGSSNPVSQRTGTFCFCGSAGLGSAVLPVVLTAFKTSPQKNKVVLSWTTASESENRVFEIEHSTDGTNFNRIASKPGNGTTNSVSNYEYTDFSAIKGINYYRLKIISHAGRHEFSNILQAKIDYGKSLSIFMNPVRTNLIIDAGNAAKVILLNINGQQLQTIQLKKGRNEIPVQHLTSGTYFIKSSDALESYKINIL